MSDFTAGVAVRADGTYVVTIRGDLDMDARPMLRELVDACVETGATALEFDLSGVTLCGSDCVGLLAYATRAELSVAVRPSATVLRTLEMVGLDRGFRILLD